MPLKTNYKNIAWNGLRKYQLIQNQDGTVSFLDVTEYTNVQDAKVLANDLNTNNDLVNRIMAGEFFYTEAESDALLALKQNVLSFDNAPTENSDNPVKSGGIKSALDLINSRIDNLKVFAIHVCQSGEYDPDTLVPTVENPDTKTFYLVPSGTGSDLFTEWIYINNRWEIFGSSQIDMSNYVTIADLQDALDDKQDVLTFDNVPTANSQNPVKSGGVKTALDGKSNTGHDHDDRYYTESEVDAKLSGKAAADHTHEGVYYTETEVDDLLGEKRDISDSYSRTEVETLLSAKSDNTHNHDNSYAAKSHNHDDRYYTESEMNTKLAAKQDTLTFDTAPTADSANPVTSGGVKTALDGKAAASHNHDGAYAAKSHTHDDRYYTETEMNTKLAAKQDTLTFDTAPTANSTNPVTSGGVKTALDGKAAASHNHDGAYAAKSHTHDDRYYTETEMDDLLDGKQDTLTFDSTPTAGSANPVTSGGVKTALDGKAASNHNHDGAYAAKSHNHDDRYYTETEMNTKLAAKQNTLTFDTAPTANSANPVTSGGVKTALDGKAAASHSHSDYTNISVLPNDNGDIKTKFRASVKGYTGSGSPEWYYKLAQLPASNNGNYASLIISGRLGGWTNGNMSYFQGLVWNRDGTGIACLDIAAGATNEAGIFNIADIVVYKDDDTSVETVYVKCKSYFTFDLDLELFQSSASILFDGTYTTSPTGTLAAQASTSTKRLSMVNGKLLVNGVSSSLEGHNHDGAYAAKSHNHDDRYYTESEMNTKLAAKQDTLTFDTAPTANSTNPVTSGGVKTALDRKAASNHNHDGVYAAADHNHDERYYTESEVNTLLSGKSDTGHTHDESQVEHHTYYVKGTQTAVTGAWTGELPEVDALYNGLTIDYWLPFAGSGNATLNLTLKGGTKTGAINCYYAETNRLTTHIGANNIIRLVYQTVTISGTSYTGWWRPKSYFANDAAYMIRNSSPAYQANSAVYRCQLLFQVDENKFTPLNNVNNSTATNKAMLTGVDFLPFGRIYYYNSTTNVAANGNMTSALYSRFQLDLRYSLNCGQTLTAHRDLYLKCVKQSNGKFRIAADPCWTQTLPSTNDGYYYIRLGRTYSTYQMYLDEEHPIYYHDGTALRFYTDPAKAVPFAALTGNPTDNSALSTALAGKAAADHNHDGAYAAKSHNHDERYYTETEMNTKLAAKQDTLTFDTTPTASSTNPVTSGGVKTALDGKAASDHNHDGTYAAADHNHDGAYAAKSHTHDDRYYTESEMNTKLAAKQDTLADSGWLSLTNASVFDGTIAYRKIGKFVYVTGQSVSLKNALTSAKIILGVMPEGYRPGKWSAFWAGRPSNVGYEATMMVFTAGGDIEFHKPASISQWNAGAGFYFSFMYMTN